MVNVVLAWHIIVNMENCQTASEAWHRSCIRLSDILSVRMNIEQVREYCLTLPGATEDMPYGKDWLVFRIEGKIFLHIWLEAPLPTAAVKLTPERCEELRDAYNAISPAYHLNKTHWNDISIEEDLPEDMIKGLIDESYQLVLSGLPKKVQAKYSEAV